MTVPLVLVIGLLLGGAGSSNPPSSNPSSDAVLPAVSVSAPPVANPGTVSICARLISALPLTLAGQNLRRTVSDPASGLIQAWGDPAIVVRCGVTKPVNLVPGSDVQLIEVNHGVLFDHQRSGNATVFTVVDRSVFIDMRVPSSYSQAPLGPIADAVVQALPEQICTTDAPDPDKLCTRRK